MTALKTDTASDFAIGAVDQDFARRQFAELADGAAGFSWGINAGLVSDFDKLSDK